MGVVHHAAYIVWFEEGRSAWMQAMGSNYADLESSGFNLAVSKVHARYGAPALYGR
jgi:acyl-CoA thioester hydrolase